MKVAKRLNAIKKTLNLKILIIIKWINHHSTPYKKLMRTIVLLSVETQKNVRVKKMNLK